MESPYYEMTHDFEEENRNTEMAYNSGYLKGYHDAFIKQQEAVKPDYKKYISIEWLQKYATLCCTFDMNKTAIHFVDTWFKMHEMCCCEKKEYETNEQE